MQLQMPMPPRYQGVVDAPAPGIPADEMYGAASDPASGTIYAPNGPLGRFARAHEIAHMLDTQVFSDGDRAYFQKAMGLKPGTWNAGTGMTDAGLHSPSELFADYFAALATHMDPHREWEAAYVGTPPSRRQLLKLGKALQRLGLRRHLSLYSSK